MNMKTLLLTLLAIPALVGCQESLPIQARIARLPKTCCNPVNLDYRFMKIKGGEGIREAADPVVVSFKDTRMSRAILSVTGLPKTNCTITFR